jgi:lysophospholipase L1-like esterase
MLLAAFATAALAVPASLGLSTAARADGVPVYYVALGDSLATGAQPAPSGELARLRAANGASHGYVDELYASARQAIPTLQLRNFGCGGETTFSLINGAGPSGTACGYVLGSQLAEAVAFLEAHHGEIAFITIDIGGNDLAPCFFVLDFTSACLGAHLPPLAANLATILAALREAAGAGVPIVGMNYYDPFLGFWALGLPGLAVASTLLTVEFNDALEAVYQTAGVPVADVEAAFAVTDFTVVDDLPVNVSYACALTWFCSVQDIHANDAGYAAIARSFEEHLP